LPDPGRSGPREGKIVRELKALVRGPFFPDDLAELGKRQKIAAMQIVRMGIEIARKGAG